MLSALSNYLLPISLKAAVFKRFVWGGGLIFPASFASDPGSSYSDPDSRVTSCRLF